MTRWKQDDRARIEYRRQWVARFHLRGFKPSEIVQLLSLAPPRGAGITNPATGEPYDRSTVSRDLTALTKQWRAAALEDTDTLRGRQVAELQEARHEAWRAGDYAEVRHNLGQEAKLLGTEMPTEVKHSGTGQGGAIQVGYVGLGRLTDEELDALADIARRVRPDTG